MGPMFLASRSTLGSTVLVLPVVGRAFVLQSDPDEQGESSSWQWGAGDMEAATVLADTILSLCAPPGYFWSPTQIARLATRLAACENHVWILTQADVLVIVGLTS